MSYIDDILRIQNITVEDVIRISKSHVPPVYRNKPWQHPELNHGVNLLTSEDALCCYMAAYGEMHAIKCRTTLRNMPFDSFANIEVVDWGCGQGIGTLCLTEMLNERNKLHLLQKVTLIEPSKSALERAVFHVKKFTRGATRIVPLQQYLPSIENKEPQTIINEINYDYRIIIHIFSNILDINNIDLAKIARIIPKVGTQQYIACIGPRNGNSNRIELFSSIFEPANYLTSIDAPIFGATSTNHQFSCKALCWEYDNSPLSVDAINSLPRIVAAEPVLDDYELQMAITNGLVRNNVAPLIEQLQMFIGDDDIVYYKPTIEGATADIAIVRPNAGIYIIQVFDADLTHTNGYAPIRNLKQIKEDLITLHIKQSADNYLSQSGYWSVIKMIGYFPNNTTAQIEQYCRENNIQHDYDILIGHDVLNGHIKDILNNAKFFQSNRNFTSTLKNDFLKLISPGWHSYKEGRAIPFTTEQRNLLQSHPGKQKIKGVAGSGKTEVLVQRAVNAQIRTGERILILTYNLSLRNYIRQRLAQVRADFAWDKFYITNYHQFIKSEVIRLNLDTIGISYDDGKLFEGLANVTERYAAIFIDEIQDYKPGWLSIINEYFLADHGELVVFGDSKQQMYDNCEFDDHGDIRIGVIPGSWNGSLSSGMRHSNPLLAHFTNLFSHQFLGEELRFTDQQQQLALDVRICFKQLKGQTIESICQCIYEELQKMHVNIQDVPDLAILSDKHGFVRQMEATLSMQFPDLAIITTSENQSQYDAILSKHHNDGNDPKFTRDIEQLRRTKKVHFEVDKSAIKISTIQSFKGLEAEIVVVIVTSDCKPSTLYTGLTRAKNSLIIISLGNAQYDSFFQENIK